MFEFSSNLNYISTYFRSFRVLVFKLFGRFKLAFSLGYYVNVAKCKRKTLLNQLKLSLLLLFLRMKRRTLLKQH